MRGAAALFAEVVASLGTPQAGTPQAGAWETSGARTDDAVGLMH